jgi:hypothetical protein
MERLAAIVNIAKDGDYGQSLANLRVCAIES